MKSFFLKQLILLLALTSLTWANEAVKNPINEDPSRLAGREMGRLFRAATFKIEKPAPKPKPATIIEPGVPNGGRNITVNAYSYCLRGRTASGRYTEHGCIAVDPRVIPLGSRIYVPGYGWGVAADTGGAIIGNKIDLWMPSASQCYQWGIRTVGIKVFPPTKR